MATKKITGMQAMRLVLYAVAVLAGLAAVIADTLGYGDIATTVNSCLLYTSPSPRDS